MSTYVRWKGQDVDPVFGAPAPSGTSPDLHPLRILISFGQRTHLMDRTGHTVCGMDWSGHTAKIVSLLPDLNDVTCKDCRP